MEGGREGGGSGTERDVTAKRRQVWLKEKKGRKVCGARQRRLSLFSATSSRSLCLKASSLPYCKIPHVSLLKP